MNNVMNTHKKKKLHICLFLFLICIGYNSKYFSLGLSQYNVVEIPTTYEADH